MDRAKHREISTEIEKLLSVLGDKHGYVVKYKGGNYDPTGSGLFKIEFSPVAENGTVLDRDASTFQRSASRFGLGGPENLGRVIKVYGKSYKILGLRPSSHKYPVIVLDVVAGKKVKLPLVAVQQGLDIKPTHLEAEARRELAFEKRS